MNAVDKVRAALTRPNIAAIPDDAFLFAGVQGMTVTVGDLRALLAHADKPVAGYAICSFTEDGDVDTHRGPLYLSRDHATSDATQENQRVHGFDPYFVAEVRAIDIDAMNAAKGDQ